MTSRSTVKSLGKGYMRGIILALLAENPRYGYEILQAMSEASDGWRPSPGTIYPILHDLYEHGFITKKVDDKEGRRRIIYKLRARGRADLENAARQHMRFVAMMRQILGKHGGPRFPGTPAFNVDETLSKLQHAKLFLDEVALIPEEIKSDPHRSRDVLQNRLRLLKDHKATLQKAINQVEKEIQNLKKTNPKET